MEAGRLSMSPGLSACDSNLRAPRAVWSVVGPSGTEARGRQSCFPAL